VPPIRKPKDKHQPTTGASAAGILALLVDAREARIKDDKDATKTEVLLDNAGLSLEDIAAVMGRKYDAIRVSLQRSRRK
jgi:DNA-directed RNA polymerase specialized sigma24 family protein